MADRNLVISSDPPAACCRVVSHECWPPMQEWAPKRWLLMTLWLFFDLWHAAKKGSKEASKKLQRISKKKPKREPMVEIQESILRWAIRESYRSTSETLTLYLSKHKESCHLVFILNVCRCKSNRRHAVDNGITVGKKAGSFTIQIAMKMFLCSSKDGIQKAS